MIFSIVTKPKGYDELSDWHQSMIRKETASTFNTWRATFTPVIGKTRSIDRASREAARHAADIVADYKARERLKTRCGAKTRKGTPCQCKALPGKKRCKFHGGMSTGARTLAGRIKALQGLRQYKGRPDLLEARIERLKAEWLDDPNYAPQGYKAGEPLPAGI